MQAARTRTLAAAGPALLIGAYASAIALWPGAGGKLILAAPLVLAPLLWWTLAKPWAWMAGFAAAALLLPPLPFALGDTGAHPSLALAALGVIAGCLRIGEWRVEMDALNRRMLLLAAILAASAAMALWYSGESVALGSLLRTGLFCISVYAFFYAAYGPGAGTYDSFRALRFLFWIAVASAAFACLDFYFQFPPPADYGRQFIWLQSGIYRRAQGLFYEAGMLGNLCAFFLTMIAVALARPGTSPLRRRALLAGGGIFAAALLLSFSRSSLLNLAVAICALMFLDRGKLRLRRFAARAAVLLTAAALAAAAIFPVFARLYWTRILNSLVYFTQSPNAILSGRLDTWQYLFRFLADHPLYAILGVGYKTLPYSSFAGRTVIADNSYLSFLIETGIVGLSAMLALSFAILRRARVAAASSDRRAAFFGTWIFCFWCGEMAQMMSGDILTYWRVLPLYFWVLAMAIRSR